MRAPSCIAQLPCLAAVPSCPAVQVVGTFAGLTLSAEPYTICSKPL